MKTAVPVRLFEKKDRNTQDAKCNLESEWDYLDRSGRVEAQCVRTFLEYWVSEYPGPHRDELISRIVSGDNRHFQSATFEVLVFALLRSAGCTVTVHPDLINGPSHPDFLAVTANGEPVYVEAVLASEYSVADVSARKRMDVVLNAIEKIRSPNFFVIVHSEGYPKTPPSINHLKKKLYDWLIPLDPDAFVNGVPENDYDAIPRMLWKHDGWQIVFEAIAKKPEDRGKGQKAIAALLEGGRVVNASEQIRHAVKTKGNHYGRLPHPLVLAVNVDSLFMDRIDEMQALFGEEEYDFHSSYGSHPPKCAEDRTELGLDEPVRNTSGLVAHGSSET